MEIESWLGLGEKKLKRLGDKKSHRLVSDSLARQLLTETLRLIYCARFVIGRLAVSEPYKIKAALAENRGTH
jgi:hypothetical protein